MMNESIAARKNDLLESIRRVLKGYKCSIKESENGISVQFSNDIVIGLYVEESGYCIYNVSDKWAKETTYYCDKEDDGTIFYYLDCIDECIGEIGRIAKIENKNTTKPVVNDGTLLSVFSSIEDQYPEFIFTNVNAKDDKEKNAVYIYSQNMSRRNNVIFEIWLRPREGAVHLYIKREFLTDAEYEESSRTYGKTSATRGRISRRFKSDQELLDFMIPKLNMAKNA